MILAEKSVDWADRQVLGKHPLNNRHLLNGKSPLFRWTLIRLPSTLSHACLSINHMVALSEGMTNLIIHKIQLPILFTAYWIPSI